MFRLVALDGDLKGQRFSLERPCLLGRGPLNHIVLDDPRISRQHAKIALETSGFVLYDFNSANGTFVNDIAVRRHVLASDDVIRIGPFQFRFEMFGPAEVESSIRDENPTYFGVEAPTRIIGSVDAKRLTNAAMSAGLSELEDADRKLHTLYAFLRSSSSTFVASNLLDRILSDLLEVFPKALTVSAYLPDPDGNMVPRAALNRDRRQTFAANLNEQVLVEVVQKGCSVLSAGSKEGIASLHPLRQGTGTLMHAPLIFQGVVQGVLRCEASGEAENEGFFAQSDLDLLTGISAFAAILLQNARLHVEVLKQQRLAQDLLFAREVQKSFLPYELPKAEGVTFTAVYEPAFTVGGDFYDVFWLPNGRIGMFVGDVSGKGVSAALLMARISSDLRTAAFSEVDPGRALARVNSVMVERGQHDVFVTVAYLTLDVARRHVVLSNAGHLPPLLRRQDRSVERIDFGGGAAIGLVEGEQYEQVGLDLRAGDALLLYTDGVLEARNASGEDFGFARLEASTAKAEQDPTSLSESVLRNLRAHVRDAPNQDDMTLLVCGLA